MSDDRPLFGTWLIIIVCGVAIGSAINYVATHTMCGRASSFNVGTSTLGARGSYCAEWISN